MSEETNVSTSMERCTQRILFIKPESWHVAKRMLARTIFLAVLTALGLWVCDTLVESGFGNRYALVRRFPDFIPLMMAAAKFTFIEMSVFWIRFGTQPKNDNQEAINVANTSSIGAAAVHFTNTLQWAFRIGVFLYLLNSVS